MCVSSAVRCQKELDSGISFLSNCLGSSYLVGLCCHPTLCLSLSLSSLCSPLPYLLLPQGGSPPSQVTLPEQIPQRRAIPTNTSTMSLWSVTSSDSQGTVIYNVETDSALSSRDTGRDNTVNPACLTLFYIEGLPRRRKRGESEMFLMQESNAENLGN